MGQESYFENILIKPATCEEENGSIQIDPPPSYIDYLWQDSVESLDRFNLAPGSYTISGEDEEGCIETIVLEVPDISDCAFELITWEVPQPIPTPGAPIYPCIVVGFNFTLDGIDVPHEHLDINWTVTVPLQTFPYINVYTSNESSIPVYTDGTVVDLDISLQTEFGAIPCCSFSDKITINDECPPLSPPDIFVSKSTFRDGSNASTIPGMVELLVYGDGNCESTTDIRGFIIDDNNGQLILGQDSTLTNGAALHVNDGFVKFSNDPNWAAIPNGSIITIFESGHALNTSLLSIEDPTDSNQDFHYILALENPTYFEGSTAQWDYNLQHNTYQGGATQPSWSLIEANGETDAMQVRYPDGTYCHGFSYGKNSASAEENNFALYLSKTSHPYCQIQMDELSYLDKSAFSIQEITGGFQPGQMQSANLQAIVEQLRDCNQPGPSFVAQENTTPVPNLNTETAEKGNHTLNAQSILEVYPNPFEQFLQVSFQSQNMGLGHIKIYDGQGRLVQSYDLQCNGFLQHLEIEFDRKSSGLFFIHFQPPNAEAIVKKAVLLKSD